MSEISPLKEARKKLNFTQKQIADKIGIKQSIISKIENGNYFGSPLILYLKFLSEFNQINIRQVIQHIKLKTRKAQ